MASVNGKRTGGSIKELIDSLHPNPLVVVKRYAFDPAYRRGSPLKKMRGLGVFFYGVWGRVPQWVWAKLKVCCCHAGHGSAKPKCVADPY